MSSKHKNNSINESNEVEVVINKGNINGVIKDYSKDVIKHNIINENYSDEKNKDGHSTLCNTVNSSVHHPDNDMAIDTEIKEINFSKSIFTDTIEKTKYELKNNEYSINKMNKKNDKPNESIVPNNQPKEEILYSLDDLTEQNWNQFDENEKLYKVHSTYAEKYYNSEIDLLRVPEQVKKAAELIEKELKLTKSKSSHVNEERGINLEGDKENEETKYSSVLRNKNIKICKSTKQNLKGGISCGKILIYLIFILILFIGYRVHKISQRNSTLNEDEDINIIVESSNLEESSVTEELKEE